MPDTTTISLTYRGVVAHRGIAISGETYGKTWTLRLANDVWTLTDHNGNELHVFSQKDLHCKLALPGSLPGYKDLYLVGLGPQIHTFQPYQEVVDALKPYVEQSERANAPQLARYHRWVGLGFLGFGVLCLAGCLLALFSSLRSDFVLDSLKFSLALMLIPPTLGVGGYFIVCGIRDLRKAQHFARMPMGRASTTPGRERCPDESSLSVLSLLVPQKSTFGRQVQVRFPEQFISGRSGGV